MSEEDFTGHVMQCSKGRIGLITHRKELPWGMSWVGINLEDGSPWSSRDPQPVEWEDVKQLSDSKVGSVMMDKDRLIEDLRRNSNERLEEARRLRRENESLMDERDMWREKYYELKRSVTPGCDHDGTK